jgi:hypothetical protein
MGTVKASASMILLKWLVVSVCFAGPLRVLGRNIIFRFAYYIVLTLSSKDSAHLC